jgi:hypothetical protein
MDRMPKNSNIKSIRDVAEHIDRMHGLYIDKQDQACAYDQHADALRHEGATNVLMHLLIELGFTDNARQRETEFDKRKVKRANVNK